MHIHGCESALSNLLVANSEIRFAEVDARVADFTNWISRREDFRCCCRAVSERESRWMLCDTHFFSEFNLAFESF